MLGLPSQFWFIISAASTIALALSFMVACCAASESNLSAIRQSLVGAAIFALLAITALAFGFKSPPKCVNLELSAVAASEIEKIVRKEVSLRISKLADEYKYQILMENK